MSEAVTPVVEPAGAGDLPGLEAHLAAAGLPSVGLADAVGMGLVVRGPGGIVASAALEPHGTDVLLRSVAVAGSLRGTGLGARIVRDAIDLARRHGFRRVYLLTESAAGWFPRFGFAPVPRDELPPAIARSREASEACADTAVAMVLQVRDESVR